MLGDGYAQAELSPRRVERIVEAGFLAITWGQFRRGRNRPLSQMGEEER